MELKENGMYVITPAQYAIGVANGISQRNVYQRVNYYGYTIEEAITKPFEEKIYFTNEEKIIMNANNVLPTTARQRINALGWSREEAISIPVAEKRLRNAKCELTYEQAKLELEYAIKNQVSINTNKLTKLLGALGIPISCKKLSTENTL